MHPNVCNINAPDLVWSFNVQLSEKVRSDELRMIPLALVGLWKDGVNSHDPHHSAYLLPVYTNPMVPANDLGDGSIAPCRVIRVQFIDFSHDEQILIRDASLLGRIPIDTAAVYFQQFSLTADGELFIGEINVTSSSSWVRGFQQIFFSTSQPHRSAGRLCAQGLQCALCFAPAPFRPLSVLS